MSVTHGIATQATYATMPGYGAEVTCAAYPHVAMTAEEPFVLVAGQTLTINRNEGDGMTYEVDALDFADLAAATAAELVAALGYGVERDGRVYIYPESSAARVLIGAGTANAALGLVPTTGSRRATAHHAVRCGGVLPGAVEA